MFTSVLVACSRRQTDLRTVASRLASSFSVVRRIETRDVVEFCHLVGDSNPIHSTGTAVVVVPGMLVMSLVAGVVGTNLPGSVLVRKSAEFKAPLFAGQSVKIYVRSDEEKLRKLCNLNYECECVDTGQTLLVGQIRVKLRTSVSNAGTDVVLSPA
jgi:acyl dehydratase